MNKRISVLLVTAAALLASGCGSLLVSKSPPSEVIWLDLPSAATKAEPRDTALRVVVDAAPGLDTDSVLVLDAGRRLRPLGSAQWPDHLPEVFETLARQSLETGGGFRNVLGRHDVESADAELWLELRRFFGLADHDDQVHSVVVDVAATLRCSPAADQFFVAVSTPVPDASDNAVIDAYRFATADALEQLTTRVSSQSCDR